MLQFADSIIGPSNSLRVGFKPWDRVVDLIPSVVLHRLPVILHVRKLFFLIPLGRKTVVSRVDG